MSHCYFTRFNPERKRPFWFCPAALLGINRNPKQKYFLDPAKDSWGPYYQGTAISVLSKKWKILTPACKLIFFGQMTSFEVLWKYTLLTLSNKITVWCIAFTYKKNMNAVFECKSSSYPPFRQDLIILFC